MYELITLSILMQFPAHGFQIAKIINDCIGPVARASNGRIYPLLNKLAADGLVDVQDETTEGGLPVRIYRITDTGRHRFHELMMDTTSNPKDYRAIFAFKANVLYMVAKPERLHLLSHYITFCEAHIRFLIAEAEAHHELAALLTKESLAATVEVMDHTRQVWELERAWAMSLRAREAAQEGDPPLTLAGTMALLTALDTLADAIGQSTAYADAARANHLAAVAELRLQVGRSTPLKTVVLGILRALQDSLGADATVQAAIEPVCQRVHKLLGEAP